MKYCLFVGRYQALHEGHKYLFRIKIMEGKPILVAIRDVPPDEKNPFTANQVVNMFVKDEECGKWIEEGKMKLMIIPDIEGIYYGRDVGYKVEQISVPQEIADISATKVREQMRKEGKL
jgi:nicotinamide mononucleotide adenylyltransferase